MQGSARLNPRIREPMVLEGRDADSWEMNLVSIRGMEVHDKGIGRLSKPVES